MNQVQNISFHGQTVPVFTQNNQHYVAMKPICENIGLDWKAQYDRIKRHAVLSEGMVMITTPSKGGEQQTICLPLDYLNGWLFSVEATRVKPQIRESLLQYQRECFRVLNEYFNPKTSQPKLAQTTVADRTPLRQAVSALVGKCNIDYSSAYSMVHQRFGVDSIEEIAADKLPDAVAYIHALTLHSGLVAELLDKQPAPAAPVLDDALLLAFARLLLHAQDMRLFVNRYLPAFQNLGIDGRGSLWSFVHDTEPTFAAVRRFMTAQSVQSGFFARDWAWVQSRILSTARAF